MDNEKLIRKAKNLVALITSFSKESEFANRFPILYDIFQEHANELNESLGDNKFSWDDEIK